MVTPDTESRAEGGWTRIARARARTHTHTTHTHTIPAGAASGWCRLSPGRHYVMTPVIT